MTLRAAVSDGLAARIFGAGAAPALALVRAAWPRVVGADLARRTEILAIEGTTLRLRVPDVRWRKVLHRMQGDILRRLRELVGSVAPRRLGFTEGPVSEVPSPPRSDAPPSAAPPAPPRSLVAAAAAIEDDEIRARFLASAARYLARAAPPSRPVEDPDA